jgi:hypothetical protein
MSREERKPENLPWKPFAYSTSDMWLCYAALKRIGFLDARRGNQLS